MVESTSLHITPVWVSSRSHLVRFDQVKRSVPWYRQLLGERLQIPNRFPRVAIGTREVPLVYFASGELTLSPVALEVVAAPPGSPTYATRPGLDRTFRFSLIHTQPRPSVSRYRDDSVWPSYFSITWIEVSPPATPESILLCVGGRGPGMGRIRDRTDQLFTALTSWVQRTS